MNDDKTIECLVQQLDQARRTIVELKAAASRFKQMQDRLRENEDQFTLHFSLSNDVMFCYDSRFSVLNVSPNVERVLGYRPDELIGRAFHELGVLDAADLDRAKDNALHVLSGGVIPATVYRFITKSGLRRFGEVSGVPLRQGEKITGVISVARDVTERIQMEEELDRHRTHLEALVEERAAELVKANERLRQEMQELMQTRQALDQTGKKLDAYRTNLEDLVRERTAALTTANEILTREVEERKRMEHALSDQEEKYRLYFSLSNDVMFSW
ncbi:MAG TPA: PAS domain S-box protein, partial [Deltaproteobacteria bacterium]|nr:PAS domain S-box protein [Deltaproteobacteria bacterium]